jgi:hypothetical protein
MQPHLIRASHMHAKPSHHDVRIRLRSHSPLFLRLSSRLTYALWDNANVFKPECCEVRLQYLIHR